MFKARELKVPWCNAMEYFQRICFLNIIKVDAHSLVFFVHNYFPAATADETLSSLFRASHAAYA